MTQKTVSKELRQEIADCFLISVRRKEKLEFQMEFGRVGLKFVSDNVDPSGQDQFVTAFDELVNLKCRPKILAGRNHSFAVLSFNPVNAMGGENMTGRNMHPGRVVPA